MCIPEQQSYSVVRRRLWLPIILAIVGLRFAAVVPIDAQEAPIPSSPGFGETMDVGDVLVPVVVRSGDAHVRDLKRKDFKLFVDGEPVPIVSFAQGTESPIRVVFLQDVSGSMALGGRLERSRELLPYFLRYSRPADRFAVATFALDRVSIDVPFTDSHQALSEAALAWRAHGTTGLHDAVAWLPQIAADDPHLRHAAILLTDGIDNASTIEPRSARQKVRRAKIPVYVIGLRRDTRGVLTPPAGAVEDEGGLLRLLAHETGGRYYAAPDRTSLLLAGARILGDLRYQYVLGFPIAESGAVRSRSIEVRVGRKKVDLTYRHGYEGLAPMVGTSGGL